MLIAFENSFDKDQVRYYVGTDLDPNFFASDPIHERLFGNNHPDKMITKRHVNLPRMQSKSLRAYHNSSKDIVLDIQPA